MVRSVLPWYGRLGKGQARTRPLPYPDNGAETTRRDGDPEYL